jgi:hypothetical protein
MPRRVKGTTQYSCADVRRELKRVAPRAKWWVSSSAYRKTHCDVSFLHYGQKSRLVVSKSAAYAGLEASKAGAGKFEAWESLWAASTARKGWNR